MEKKKRYGNTLKEQYLASARDRIGTFLLAAGEVRGAILNGTRMVNEMRANHELGILETLVLGRAYLGIALMAAGLKGSDRVALQINCSGPIKGLSVEAEPDNVGALLMRASAYAHWKKDPERALADANRVLELDPNRLEAYEPRILALVDLGRRDEAGEALAEAGRKMAEKPELAGGLAWHCVTTAVFAQEAGEIDRARETFARCLSEHPTSLDAVQSAVSFHDSLGQSDRSLEILRTALAALPNARGLRTALADRLRVQGQVGEAEALTVSLGARAPPHASLL